jgi:hypothetical protein
MQRNEVKRSIVCIHGLVLKVYRREEEEDEEDEEEVDN